jgi:hypothetical protein
MSTSASWYVGRLIFFHIINEEDCARKLFLSDILSLLKIKVFEIDEFSSFIMCMVFTVYSNTF